MCNNPTTNGKIKNIKFEFVVEKKLPVVLNGKNSKINMKKNGNKYLLYSLSWEKCNFFKLLYNIINKIDVIIRNPIAPNSEAICK